MIDRLDRLFLWARRQPFFWRMVLFTRILLAAGFIPTGMVKLLGRRFTVISPETPIGGFFEAMYQTGLFWNFIGATQIAAGLLLLLPRWAHLGAVLFLPVITSIFVITVALDFRGTPVVTGLMLLATLFLCVWDYHRFRGVLTERAWPEGLKVPSPRLDRLERVGFVLFAVAILSFFASARFAPVGVTSAPVLLGVAAGLFTLLRFLFVGRRMRVD